MARRIDPHVHFRVPGQNDLFWMVDAIKPALSHTFLPPDVKKHFDRHNIEGVVKVQAGRSEWHKYRGAGGRTHSRGQPPRSISAMRS